MLYIMGLCLISCYETGLHSMRSWARTTPPFVYDVCENLRICNRAIYKC